MIQYIRRILAAAAPDHWSEALLIAVVAPVLSYFIYMGLIKDTPNVQVYSETSWPPKVHQNETLTIEVDISFDETCTVTARRILRAADGAEYVVSEDIREVVANERTQYSVNVPISTAIPTGPATVRGEFAYACDFWSRYVKARTRRGTERPIEVLSAAALEPARLSLPPKEGYVIVRAHYRKLPKQALRSQPPTSQPK